MALVEGGGGPTLGLAGGAAAGAGAGSGNRGGRGGSRGSSTPPTLGGSSGSSTSSGGSSTPTLAPGATELQPMPTWVDTLIREREVEEVIPYSGASAPGARAGAPAPAVETESVYAPGAPNRANMSIPREDDVQTVIRREVVSREKERTEKNPAVAKEMTWERYNNLTGLQRAAVDFNTLLVEAREKDLQNQKTYDPTAREEKRYDKQVEKMFGEEGASEVYAPETFGLLQQLEYTPEKGVDLDEFISLKAAIQKKDLKDYNTKGSPLNTLLEPRTEQFDLGQEMAVETRQLKASMAKTTELLSNFHQRVALARNDITDFYGGKPTKGELPVGLGTGEMDVAFKNMYEYIADKASGVDAKSLPDFLANGSTPEQRAAFIRYVDDRTRTTGKYNIDVGMDDTKRYLNTDQIRAMFGFDKKGG